MFLRIIFTLEQRNNNGGAEGCYQEGQHVEQGKHINKLHNDQTFICVDTVIQMDIIFNILLF